MSSIIPGPLADLIEALGQLPGVGARTAERYAYYLLRADPARSGRIVDSLSELHSKLAYCPKTFALIDASLELSPLYTDPKRNKQQIAVVADPFDIVALEKTNSFHGTYHVLGGLISPIDNIGPEQLKINQLIKR